MKKSIIAGAMLCVFAAISCGNSNEAPKSSGPSKEEKAAIEAKKASGNLPNYRYVDLDTVLSRYYLAKDYNEQMMRMQTNMESQVKSHENQIQNLANSMQSKMQNNSYTEQTYKADQQKMASLQNSAQQSVATLQKDFETQAMQAQQTVNDSITAYIKEYNASHGYDAILFKAATLYIDPALDITEEVIEGLNARYNKKK